MNLDQIHMIRSSPGAGAEPARSRPCADRNTSGAVQMTGGVVVGRDLDLLRDLDAAAIHREGAARVEVTSAGRVDRARQFAFHRFEPALAALDPRDLGQERPRIGMVRSEEHTSELQSLMRTSYAVFCLKKKHTR